MKNKKVIIAAVVVVLLLVVGSVFVLAGKSKKTPTTNTTQGDSSNAAIPTVDSSVQVDLKGADSTNRDVILSITKLPKGTQSVDYEMSYPTKEQGLQGLASTLDVTNGSNSVEKKVTLGTCSSGTCVYHQLAGNIRLSLKFNGSYGERIFEKEYSL